VKGRLGEQCRECDNWTGRTGNDSLYVGDLGPLCESCYDKHGGEEIDAAKTEVLRVVERAEGAEQKLADARAEIAELLSYADAEQHWRTRALRAESRLEDLQNSSKVDPHRPLFSYRYFKDRAEKVEAKLARTAALLDCAKGRDTGSREFWRYFNEAQAALADKPTPMSPCVWREDEDGVWHTTCLAQWVLNDGTPAENNMFYCHCCGRQLSQEPYA